MQIGKKEGWLLLLCGFFLILLVFIMGILIGIKSVSTSTCQPAVSQETQSAPAPLTEKSEQEKNISTRDGSRLREKTDTRPVSPDFEDVSPLHEQPPVESL